MKICDDDLCHNSYIIILLYCYIRNPTMDASGFPIRFCISLGYPRLGWPSLTRRMASWLVALSVLGSIMS